MSPRSRSDLLYARQFFMRYAVLYLGCRWGRLWGSVIRFTVGCGLVIPKHDDRFNGCQVPRGDSCTKAVARCHRAVRPGRGALGVQELAALPQPVAPGLDVFEGPVQ